MPAEPGGPLHLAFDPVLGFPVIGAGRRNEKRGLTPEKTRSEPGDPGDGDGDRKQGDTIDIRKSLMAALLAHLSSIVPEKPIPFDYLSTALKSNNLT